MHVKTSFALKLLAVILVPLLLIPAVSAKTYADQLPGYAFDGGYVEYSALGGFIPFFSGVQVNMTYTITQVFSNGTMLLNFVANGSQGDEVPNTNSNLNYSDSIYSPSKFPAIPPSGLTARQIIFQNVTATYKQDVQISVPAGRFDTVEFEGTAANDTTVFFWFDKTTGIAVQMGGGLGAVQLLASNIATPVSSPSGLAVSLPFVLVFVLVFAVGGLLFWGLIRYYNRQAARSKIKAKQNARRG